MNLTNLLSSPCTSGRTASIKICARGKVGLEKQLERRFCLIFCFVLFPLGFTAVFHICLSILSPPFTLVDSLLFCIRGSCWSFLHQGDGACARHQSHPCNCLYECFSILVFHCVFHWVVHCVFHCVFHCASEEAAVGCSYMVSDKLRPSLAPAFMNASQCPSILSLYFTVHQRKLQAVLAWSPSQA